ncbi:MAG: hypothetical protein LBI44_06850 [Oscillospiraceae bacterium]|jgi:hypothetical protein|nr:hypothetical protein [Oscillospiraceae bacterium]
MKTRKLISALCLAALLAFTFAAPTLAADGDIVWDMTPAEVQAIVDAIDAGQGETGTTWLKACGYSDEVKSGNALKFENRVTWYDGIDIKTGELDASKVYTFVIKVSSDTEQIFVINRNGDYANYLISPKVKSYTFTLKTDGKAGDKMGSLTLESDFMFASSLGAMRTVRVGTENDSRDGHNDGVSTHPTFQIDGITIYEGDAPAAPSTPPQGGGSSATGDNLLIFAALGMLTLCCVVFALTRRVKAK